MKAYRDETTGRWHSDLPDVFDLICQKLRDREQFSFARYGDGEFNAIYGKKGANCDGHEYFPDMGKRLREALESKPNYIVGLQPLTLASDRWPQIQSDFPNIKWVDADCIHNASIDHRLEKLFHVLRRRDVMVVGPSHIVGVAKALGVHWFMLPYMNCWERFGAVRNWIINESAKFDNPVVLLCASMMSEVLIDEFKNCDNMTMIDMGSVLDPFVGVKSRRYHHKLKI